MHRFYVNPENRTEDLFSLEQEDLKHAVSVLRLKPGDPVEIISDGKRFSAVVREVSPGTVSAQMLEELPSTEPRIRLALFQGLPKSDKMELIIQKAVELGVSEIIPVKFARCVVRYSDADAEKKTLRWQKIAREAGKQSGRCVIPAVRQLVSVSAVPGLCRPYDAAVVPWEESTSFGPKGFCESRPVPVSLAVIIGPEGGIEPAEVDLLRSSGIVPLTLGRRILRTETAGIAAVSAFLSLYGEME